MTQPQSCNHAYGLKIVHCSECQVHVASLCPECGYESRYDDDHRPDCKLRPAPAAAESLAARKGPKGRA